MKQLQATKSIVIYGDTYAEVHDIKDGEFGSGRPLKTSEIKAFDHIVKSEKKITEKFCMPYRNILGYQSDVLSDRVAWIYPAGQIHLEYSNQVKGLKTGMYYIPNIVFVSDGKSINVYAIKRKDILKLRPETQLYHAPFMNVSERGNVCVGSAKILKFNNVTEMLQSIEGAFWKSKFTHTNHTEIVEGGIVDCYKDQVRSFNEKLLLPSKKLKDIWN